MDSDSPYLDWYIDLEIALVKQFGWSLRDIDETDIESLLPFIFRLNSSELNAPAGSPKRLYCDQVGFL
jgi:hypothetical protein